MFKSIFTNTIGIFVSRVLGLIRDMLTASILGANIFSDIFFVAFKLPNLFRRIFAEGAFTQSFLPAFTKSRHKALFSTHLLVRFSIIILSITLLVTLFSKQATMVVAWGFEPSIQALAAPYVAVNFIYLILIFWVTFFSALLHYKHHFATSAFSTALLNLALIAALLLAHDREASEIVWFLSYGVVLGGILQLAAHLIAIKKLGFFPMIGGGFKYFKSKGKAIQGEYNRFKHNFLPAMWGNSTAQISAFLDTLLASFLVAGSISYLYYANRIFQLPLALFAIATSIALFPRIAKAIKNNDTTHMHYQFQKAVHFLLAILAVATLGGIIFNEEILWLLFERGAFTATDRIQTGMVLVMYMLGLLPFGLAKLFILYLYAREQQRHAATIATIALGSNIIFSLMLIVPLEAVGLALASTLSGVISFYLTIKAYGLKQFFALFSFRYLVLLSIALIVIGMLFEWIHYYLEALFISA